MVNLRVINDLNSTRTRVNIPTSKEKNKCTEVLVMVVMKAIIDVWNLLEKYDIEYVNVCSTMVAISNAEYERLLGSSKNKQYIQNLRNRSPFAIQWMACH